MSRERILRESNKEPATTKLTEGGVVQDVHSIARACLFRTRTNHDTAAIHSRERGIALTTECPAERPTIHLIQVEVANTTSPKIHAQYTLHRRA